MFNRSDTVEYVDAISSQLSQTNIVGNVHLFHLFLPLILKGKVKKVITISTGLADLDLTNECTPHEIKIAKPSISDTN